MSTKLEQSLIIHCSPAICGIKASNLINCNKKDFNDIKKEIILLNKKYNPILHFTTLKETDETILLLVYRTKSLNKVIENVDNIEYLKSKGYNCNDLKSYLLKLKERLNSDIFPHEIGIFLGYSLDDVIEFEKSDSKPLYTGYWKVYSNLEEKLKLFNRYDRCKNCVIKLTNKGFKLENFMKGN